MSDEILVRSELSVRNGNFLLPKQGGVQSIDQNAVGGGVPGLMLATTAGVDVTTTGITTLGYCWLKNLDSSNYVEWGPLDTAVFYPIGKMKPGESAGPFRLSPGKTLHLKANMANCKVQVIILED
jgi:hypothetical protein